MMKILQYNCQSLDANGSGIEMFLNTNYYDVVCLSEVFSKNKKKRNKLINFNLIEKKRSDGYGGVAIGLRKYIKYKKIAFESTYDVIMLRTTNLFKNFVICSIYLPPNLEVEDFAAGVTNVLQFLEPFENVLILGDFNARNCCWGDTLSLPKGKWLEDELLNYNFSVLNTGSHTFVKSVKDLFGTVPDLSLSNSMEHCVWEVLPVFLGGSHHYPISISFPNIKMKYGSFVAKSKLLSSLKNVELDPNIEKIQDTFREEINDARYRLKDNRSPKFWWHDGLKTTFRLHVAARKKCTKYPTPDNFETAIEAMAKWKNEVAEAKKQSYNDRLQHLNENPGSREGWQFVKNVKNGMAGHGSSQWDDDNNFKYLEYLRDQVPVNNIDEEDDLKVLNYNDEDESLDFNGFSFDEFEKCLAGKTKSSAGGCDGITYEMVRSLQGIAKRSLLTALNNAFLSNNIVDDWRLIKVVPIPKPNKDLADFRNFRPISLISVLLKIINLMMKDHINETLESSNLLPDRCFAYRRAKSTAMCINELLHNVAVLKNKGHKVLVMALDINNAYNCVKISILMNILEKIGLNRIFCRWIGNFLSNRILKIGFDQITVTNGIPQGSCLSPILFNIYTKSLHDIEDENTMIFQYADDFLIVSHDKDFKIAEYNMKIKVKQFISKCSALNLSFNPEKTNIIYLAKGSKKTVNIKINDVPIKQVNKLKYLGRFINSSLTVTDHYKQIISESGNRNRLMRCLTPVKGGLNPKVATNLYKSLVRSKLEYARTTMAISPVSVNKKIAAFQNATLRRCMGLTPSTPIQIIYVLANELPPRERGIYLTAKEIVNLKFNNYKVYRKITDNLEVKSSYSMVYYRYKEVFDNLEEGVYFENLKNINVRCDILNNKKENVAIEQIRSIYRKEYCDYKNYNFTVFATDASLSNERTGFAVYNISTGDKYYFNIALKASSTFGELWAIKMALEKAIEDNAEKIVIFTDSMSACKSLMKNSTENYCVAEIHEMYNRSSIEKFHIIWTPSHTGVWFNEVADEMAKNAIDVGAPINAKYTPDEALRIIKNELHKDWNEEYSEISKTKGKQFAEIFPAIPASPWYKGVNMPSKDIKVINRLMAGHTYDNVYLKKIGAKRSFICDKCKVKDSAQHQIFECSKFTNQRSEYKIFDKYNNVIDILKGKCLNDFKALANYIRDAKLEI